MASPWITLHEGEFWSLAGLEQDEQRLLLTVESWAGGREWQAHLTVDHRSRFLLYCSKGCTEFDLELNVQQPLVLMSEPDEHRDVNGKWTRIAGNPELFCPACGAYSGIRLTDSIPSTSQTFASRGAHFSWRFNDEIYPVLSYLLRSHGSDLLRSELEAYELGDLLLSYRKPLEAARLKRALRGY